MLWPGNAAANMTPEARAAFEKFRVELEKLRATATNLQGEVDSMYGIADRVTGNPCFGDAGIASVGSIDPRTNEVSSKMQELLTDIHGGIAAGQSALSAVTDRYEAADAKGEERMKRAGMDALEEKDFEEEDDNEGSGGSDGSDASDSPSGGGSGTYRVR